VNVKPVEINRAFGNTLQFGDLLGRFTLIQRDLADNFNRQAVTGGDRCRMAVSIMRPEFDPYQFSAYPKPVYFMV